MNYITSKPVTTDNGTARVVWRLGGAAGYSVHAVGTETRGVRTYTHVELHDEKEVVCQQRLCIPWSQVVGAISGCLPRTLSVDDVTFLRGLVAMAHAQRAIYKGTP